MTKYLMITALMLVGSFVVAAETKPAADLAPAAEKKPWSIEATPTATSVQPGQALEVNVRIVNGTDAKQTIYVRSLLWYARSDNPHVVFAQWPKRAGIGPAITYKPVEVAAKEAYAHSWSCTLASDAPAGDVSFRVGVTLRTEKGKPEEVFWSEPVKITVKGAEKQ